MRVRTLQETRGAGMIGCLLLILIVAGAIYTGLEWGLPKFRHASFEERLTETFSYFSKQPEQEIRRRLIDVAAEFEIALKPEQVKILIQGDRLTIDIDYEKTLDLKVWQKSFPYHVHRTGPY